VTLTLAGALAGVRWCVPIAVSGSAIGLVFGTLAAGAGVRRSRSITFESGPAANRHVLAKQCIFNTDVGTREGARGATSVGRFVDRCN
jgi:hypothetical protein